jgi:hypothetical protein
MKLFRSLHRSRSSHPFAPVLAAAALLTTIAGCSGEDGEIAIEAAPSPLTTGTTDALFTIKVVSARAYPLDGLVVKAVVDGNAPLTLTCVTADVDADEKLGKNDSLTCAETGTNQFDAAVAGKEVDIELYARVDGEELKVGSAPWVPAK